MGGEGSMLKHAARRREGGEGAGGVSSHACWWGGESHLHRVLGSWWSHQRKQALQLCDAVVVEINFDIRGLKVLLPANSRLCPWAMRLRFPVMDPACRALWAQGPSDPGLVLNACVHLSSSGQKLKVHRTSSIHWTHPRQFGGVVVEGSGYWI